MVPINIFISVGATSTPEQEKFIQSIENRLKVENLIPNTVGRNTFDSDSPIKAIKKLMDECFGVLIIALERTYFPHGIEKRGGEEEKVLKEIRLPTPWNQVEAGMAFIKGLPVLVIVEDSLKTEGLLERGYDWYVISTSIEQHSLITPEFNGVLASWRKKVDEFHKKQSEKTEQPSKIDPSTLTIGELLKNLKPANLWSILASLVGLIGAAFTIGRYFAK